MRDASTWDERYAERELIWSAEPNRYVEQELAELTPGRAIDVAAGEGRNAIWLARRGWSVLAVDFSHVGLDKGRQLAGQLPPAAAARIDWQCADVLDYDFAPGAYELVLIAYLHLPGPSRRLVLRNAAAAVAPGGLLFIVGHALRNLQDGVGGPQDPEVLYDIATVPGEVEATGLDVTVAEERLRPVEAEDRPAIDIVLKATRASRSA